MSSRDLGVLMYTHNRVDDARVNMDILRSLWMTSGVFPRIFIVHAYNGTDIGYPQPYVEDWLIRRPNPGHFQGAAELIDAGLDAFRKNFPGVRYVMVMAADTWCIRPYLVRQLIDQMMREYRPLAASAWGAWWKNNILRVGLAVDFFVVDVHWAGQLKMFPLDFAGFDGQFGDILRYIQHRSVMLEKLLLTRFLSALEREDQKNLHPTTLLQQRLLRLKQREPVHWGMNFKRAWLRRHYFPRLGLLTHHDPKAKADLLKFFRSIRGEHFDRLMASPDTSYFNAPAFPRQLPLREL